MSLYKQLLEIDQRSYCQNLIENLLRLENQKCYLHIANKTMILKAPKSVAGNPNNGKNSYDIYICIKKVKQ